MAHRLNARLLRSHRFVAGNPGIVQVAQLEQSARPSLAVVRLKALDEQAAFVTQRPQTALSSLSKLGRASTDRDADVRSLASPPFATASACTVWPARGLADHWSRRMLRPIFVQTQSGTSLLTCACLTASTEAHIEPSVATQAHPSVQ